MELFEHMVEAGFEYHDYTKPVYKYVSIEAAKAILNNTTLQFSTPLTFNDPFEFTNAFFDFSLKMSELRARIKKLTKEEFPHIDKKTLRSFEHSMSRDEYIHNTIEALSINKKHSLICCFSEKNDSTLMWSHYSDKHRGICIGLNIPLFDIEQKLNTLRVRYINNIDPVRILTLNQTEKSLAFIKWIFSKSHIWEYEKEVRCFIPNLIKLHPEQLRFPMDREKRFAYIPIKRDAICEIYYGVGTSSENIEEIESIIKSKEYRISRKGKMVIDKNSFELKLNLF